ncbi:hypothetical protein DFH27DRAFT_461740, partial [Peziza echinospora]
YPNYNQASQIKPSTAPHLTPYLGSRSRLSQSWFNRWTVLLALIVVRVFFSAASLNSDIDSAHAQALNACVSVEKAGSSMASMPHYMAQGVNELSARSIEGGVRALQATLLMSITAVQEIVVFIVNMLVSTYVCLITLAVAGSIQVILDATEAIGEFVNNTVGKIVGELDGEISGFTKSLNSILDKFEGGIGSLFGGDIDFPKLDLNGPLDKLKKIQIPSSFDDKLQEIRDKIPNFEEVREAGQNAIRLPFQKIQENVNNSLSIYKFDRSVFPIPPKEKLSFCSENNSISDFFDNLRKIVGKTENIVSAVLIVLAVLVIFPMAWMELRRWRITRQRAAMFAANPNYDPVDITYLASRTSTGTFGMRVASYAKTGRRQVLIRWAVAYGTSPAALLVLSLGVAGLISALAQYIVIKQVETAVPELAEQVGGFAGDVVDLLNNASMKFAASTNMVTQNITDELNKEIFGWLQDGTTSVNNTLNVFSKEMSNGINKYLGGTPLEKPIEDVINCLIGLKIESLQKGLTWLKDHAKITFPPIPDDTFSLGALNSLDDNGTGKDSFLADPESTSSDMITATLISLADKWKDSISTEALISACLVLLYVFVVLIAVVRTAALWWKTDNVRGDGGG